MATSHLWQAAAALAARAHQHQLRKDHRTPYVAHPMRVALTVSQIFGFHDDAILAAALLHDVIEDTNADYDDVLEACGREVADIVAALTKDMRMVEPQREHAYDAQLAAGPWQARLIKLADVYDNLLDTYSDDSRRKQLLRVDRALELAKNDPQLAEASRIVADLAQSMHAM